MSDTVKLIIEIDKRAYKACQELGTNNDDGIIGLCAVNAIAKGTPLDSNSEKAEVQAYFDGESFGWDEGREALIEELKAEILRGHIEADLMYVGRIIEILDNIGKAESEDNEN